jgi:ParB family chromosome partitioning protein
MFYLLLTIHVSYLRQADEGTLSPLIVETAILLAASRTNATAALRDAACTYKVDTEAISLKVKQEFAAKVKAGKASHPAKKTGKAAA